MSLVRLAGSVLLGLVLLAGGTLPAPAGDRSDEKEALAALRVEANRCLKLRKTEARLRLGVPLRLAERLRESGDPKAARKVLDRIVKVDPWAMEAHLGLLELRKENGDSKAAVEKKAKWILEHAETDRVRAGVLRLLGRPVDLKVPIIEPVPGSDTRIVLVPMGPVDTLLLKAAAERAMRYVNHPVIIQNAGLSLPPGGDNPLASWTESLRAAFQPALDTPEGKAARSATGTDNPDLTADEVFWAVYADWLARTGRWKELSEFEARIQGAEPSVWPADDMNRHLAAFVGMHSREGLKFVGVTQGYMLGHGRRGRERQVFGWGGRNLGTATYGPFVSRRTGEKPDWERLVARTTKQIICVVGATFEVGRHHDRICPMRVVTDLRSLDAKGYQLCPRCAERLR